MRSHWVKPLAVIFVLGLIAWLAPAFPLDRWNLLNPKKVATMIFALALVQGLGAIAAQKLSARAGAILTGFLGGLISSTATTASLARNSEIRKSTDGSYEYLTFLTATAAMLFEGTVLVVTGSDQMLSSVLLLFLAPLVATAVMIRRQSRRMHDGREPAAEVQLRIVPILKLALFIVLILGLSKILQSNFGRNGLLILTFLVSLFEIHGSVIANVQLHDSGAIGGNFLGGLIAVSLCAGCLSKLGLVFVLGSSRLRVSVFKGTVVLLAAIGIGWGIAFG